MNANPATSPMGTVGRSIDALARRAGASALFLLTMIGLMLGLVVAAQPAFAQPASAQGSGAAAPTLIASSHEVSTQESFTAAVSFDPGGYEVGAVSLLLGYDESSLEPQACTSSGAGVCHLTPGDVRVAVLDTVGIEATAELLTVDFVVLDTAASSELTIDVKVLATSQGERLGATDVVIESGLVTLSGDASTTASTDVAASEVPVDEEAVTEEPGGLNGEVLDSDGAGVFGAEACATAADGSQACTTTTGLGAFVLDDLAPGDYTVHIIDPTGAFGPGRIDTSVSAGTVTTGLSATLGLPLTGESIADQATFLPPVEDDGDASADVDGAAASLSPAATVEDPPVALAPLSAAVGEIALRVVDPQGSPLEGVSACATIPVVGSEFCDSSDDSGVVRFSELRVSNYILTASDPQFRLGPAEPLLVGLNPGMGVVVELPLRSDDLGEVPEALAYVDTSGNSPSQATGLFATALAFGGLTAVAAFNNTNRPPRRREQ